MNPLHAFVEEQIARLQPRTWKELTRKVNEAIVGGWREPFTQSGFSRGVRERGTLEVENLLLLAKATGQPASKVLRLGNRTDIADLLEGLYVPVDSRMLGSPELQLIERWQRVPPRAQATISAIVDLLSADRHAEDLAKGKRPNRGEKEETRTTAARLVEIGTTLVELGDEVAQVGERGRSAVLPRVARHRAAARATRKNKSSDGRDD